MAEVYYLKTRRDNYFDEQMDTLLQFIDRNEYKKACFLMDSIRDMDQGHDLGNALIRHWGENNFDRFKNTRSIAFDNHKQFGYGTVRTLGYELKGYDLVVHVYADVKDFLKASRYIGNADNILVYWGSSDQPDLDDWIAILHGQNIGPTSDIQPISLDLPQDVIDELNKISSVNVSDGGRHPSDERLIKQVVQKVNENRIVVNASIFKAFLIHITGFKPYQAENAANKIKRYL